MNADRRHECSMWMSSGRVSRFAMTLPARLERDDVVRYPPRDYLGAWKAWQRDYSLLLPQAPTTLKMGTCIPS